MTELVPFSEICDWLWEHLYNLAGCVASCAVGLCDKSTWRGLVLVTSKSIVRDSPGGRVKEVQWYSSPRLNPVGPITVSLTLTF